MLALLAPGVGMGGGVAAVAEITYEGGATFQGSGTASPSHNHTVTAGTDCLVIAIHYRTNNAPTAAAFNGDPATDIILQGHNTVLHTSLWFVLNPDVGTFALTATLAGTANYVIRAHNLSGVDQSTVHRVAVGSSSSSNNPTTMAAVPSAEGDLIIDAISLRTTTASSVAPADGQDEKYEVTQGTLIAAGGTLDAAVDPATDTDADWTLNVADNWCQAAVAFIPAPPPGPPDAATALTFLGPVSLGARVSFTVEEGVGYRALRKAGLDQTAPSGPSDGAWSLVAETSTGSGTTRLLTADLATNDDDYTLAIYAYDGTNYSTDPVTVNVFGILPPDVLAANSTAVVCEVTTTRRGALVVELDRLEEFNAGEGGWRYSWRTTPIRFETFPAGTDPDDALAGEGEGVTSDGFPADSDGLIVRCTFPAEPGRRYVKALQESPQEA